MVVRAEGSYIMKYTSRDVQSNIQNLIDDARSMTHLWQPGSEADPGMILLKALAANVDLLSFNLDTQVGEMYMQSATQIKSIRRLGVANGYQPPWYRAPRVKVKIQNRYGDETDSDGNPRGVDVTLDFSLPNATNNVCFAAKNALDNLTSIPYFIVPKTNLWEDDRPVIHKKGSKDLLGPTDFIEREAVQGILKSVIINPAMLNPDGRTVDTLTYRLPAQNIDSELIWIEEVTSGLAKVPLKWVFDGSSGFLDTSTTEARYQVAVDDYNNIVILLNGAINNTIQKKNLIRIYYLETYGVAGEITENVLQLSSVSNEDSSNLILTHPGNTLDMPDGSALTGRSPLTAHEAALEARNWVNTNDSIITLKNFNAWIRRQPGISTGTAVDCQKALELNWAIRYDQNMDEPLKSKKYIKSGVDFPNNVDANGRVWNPLDGSELDFPHNFLVYRLMYFCIFNNFLEQWFDGESFKTTAEWINEEPSKDSPYRRYRPAHDIRKMLKNAYADTYNLTCEIDFGYLRVFEWCVNGVIYTKKPITAADEESLIATVMSALRVRFNAKNMEIGQLPRMMDVVQCVQEADSRIQYFDAGLLNKPMIDWCPVRNFQNRIPNSDVVANPEYFNHISFSRFIDGDTENVSLTNPYSKISVARECILPEVRG